MFGLGFLSVVSFALSIFLCSCGGCRISWALELTVSKNWHLKLRAGQSSAWSFWLYWFHYLYSVVSDLNGWLIFCPSNGIMMRFETLDLFTIV
jgi:hypothetical protein